MKDKADNKPNFFHRFAQKVSDFVGNAWVFVAMLLLVLAWIVSGPFFGFSDTWQLIINTTTTIITFLIVFIIQNTQNRDTKALQLKLDELIRVHKLAHNSLIDLDELSDEQIKELEKHFVAISKSNQESN
ncbi:low affinity iron permease family protein [Candidatus Berkiella aquae]|uniref:Low affinity iron permease n=1 Tax=Candidatus Berkiella aquae TaxID=295108 RepID=A0A0Q9YQ50_9GAMM|nr:low affinity iron permease family protein [Candidatus Berkiella aquae]MCS5711634.1 low affinity iron permease family protein [Candidatus Berkiella aquae]